MTSWHAHVLRQTNGRPQTGQVFDGNSDFLRIFDMAPMLRTSQPGQCHDAFEMTIEAIDVSNAADPNTVLVAGSPHPAEFAYGQRMSAMLDTFAPGSSDTLKIAVRGQHIRRWTIPRNTYPMDKKRLSSLAQ